MNTDMATTSENPRFGEQGSLQHLKEVILGPIKERVAFHDWYSINRILCF